MKFYRNNDISFLFLLFLLSNLATIKAIAMLNSHPCIVMAASLIMIRLNIIHVLCSSWLSSTSGNGKLLLTIYCWILISLAVVQTVNHSFVNDHLFSEEETKCIAASVRSRLSMSSLGQATEWKQLAEVEAHQPLQ